MRKGRRSLLLCLVAALVAVAFATAPGLTHAATVTSTFDASAEGWSVSGDRRTQTHVATGGNPGGFVRAVDAGATASGGDQISMWWEAPARFENLKGLYGGELQFDLRQSSVSGQYDEPLGDVLIVGGGIVASYDTPRNPGTTFTHYSVPLRENARWTTISNGRHRAITQAEMRAVLAGSYFIRIRAEFVKGPGADTDDLDNVILTSGDAVPPPAAGKSVVADVVSGVVFIEVPKGKSIRRGKGKSAVATTARFRRFKGKANIPTGSKIDTRKGRIAITSAADLKGGTGTGEFYDGIFQIKQARATKPVTDALLITSRAKCGKDSAHASASKRKLGRLWASAKGKFRTRGRYSAASVRGTTWLTEDRCDGTFTKVSRGRVAVRDNRLRKTILLTAGQSYFARAQRASSKN